MSLNQKIAEKMQQPDQDRYRCEWVTTGRSSGMQQCMFPGTTSHNTLGGGPWYCRFHFFINDPEKGAEIVAKSMVKANREAYYTQAVASGKRYQRIGTSPLPMVEREEETEAGAYG